MKPLCPNDMKACTAPVCFSAKAVQEDVYTQTDVAVDANLDTTTRAAIWVSLWIRGYGNTKAVTETATEDAISEVYFEAGPAGT